MNTDTPPPSTSRNPYTLWFVVMAFVAPVVLAYIMFYFGNISSFSNHGELLKPMVQVTTLDLKDQGDKPVPDKDLTFKWRFITFVNGTCDTACRNRLIEVRQTHRTLGKDQHRVIQVVIELAPPDASLAEFLKSELPDAIVLKGDAGSIDAAFAGTAKMLDNDIYIQDPMGYIMMRFTDQQPIVELQIDIKKLLKASQIG